MKTYLVLVAAVLLAVPVTAAEDFEAIGTNYFFEQYMAPDARSEGLGAAFTAVAEGPAGLYWNPATQLEGRTAAVGYHAADQLLDDLKFTTLSAAVEVGYLRLGGWQSELSRDDLFVRTAYLPDGAFVTDFKSRVRAGGIALDVGRLMFGEETTLLASVGVNFKKFKTSWDGETSAQATDKDLGVIVGTRHFLGDSDDVHRGWVGWRLGGALANTGEAEIEFSGATGGSKTPSTRLRQYGRVGLAIEGRHGWHCRLGHPLSWLIAADWQKSKLADGWSDETFSRYGVEVTLLGLASGRIGRADASDATCVDGTTYGGGLTFAPPGSRFGFRGDYASVPYAPPASEAPTLNGAQRLARYSAAVWLDF
ncbi:hypothetical protein KKA85_05960 [bacterium]|nr:hypothetical protein [bacterium]MBU1675309.1 hypothetical protein [bacterium]